MRRVSVVGNSGSGKSTLGRALATALGVPFLELDSILHQAAWMSLPEAQFRSAVAEVAAGDGWVIDGNYRRVQDVVWTSADTVVWFDLPRATVMRQLGHRTLHRLVRREQLWNGNRQTWRELLQRDPDRNLLVWAWTRHALYRTTLTAAAAAAATGHENGHLRFVRIGSRSDARRLLAEAAPTPTRELP